LYNGSRDKEGEKENKGNYNRVSVHVTIQEKHFFFARWITMANPWRKTCLTAPRVGCKPSNLNLFLTVQILQLSKTRISMKKGSTFFLIKQEGFAPLLENFIENRTTEFTTRYHETKKVRKKIKRITQNLLAINQF